MNPSQLSGLLDRPIAYHRCFVTVSGSITAAVILSQAVYWQSRCTHEDGWWYKTRDDWEEETGATRYEQENARAKLRKLGILAEKREGIPAKLWFKVDLERLADLLGENQPTGEGGTNQLEGGELTNWRGENQPTITETTTEITTEITTTTPANLPELASSPLTNDRGGSGDDEDKTDAGLICTGLTLSQLDQALHLLTGYPQDLAQQMLDVVQAKIQVGSIKTNPLAMLSGIIRRYQHNPADFDPLPGIHIAEARARAKLHAARLRAAERLGPVSPLAEKPRTHGPLQGGTSPCTPLRQLLRPWRAEGQTPTIHLSRRLE